MIYPNLEAEMKRHEVSKDDIAAVLGLHVSGVFRMFTGEREISVYRAKLIRDKLFPGMSLDYLFSDTGM